MTDGALKAVVFDFDGVLVESVDIKGDAFAALYETEGAAVQAQVLAYHAAHGGVTRFDKIRHFETFICGRTASERRVVELADRFGQIVEDRVVAAAAVPGAIEFLERYHRALPLYVASATPQDELLRIVERRGMDKYFKDVFGAPVKKDAHLAAVIAAQGCTADVVLMVGDAMTDYEAARKAGSRFIGRVPPGQALPFPAGTVTIPDLMRLADVTGLSR